MVVGETTGLVADIVVTIATAGCDADGRLPGLHDGWKYTEYRYTRLAYTLFETIQ